MLTGELSVDLGPLMMGVNKHNLDTAYRATISSSNPNHRGHYLKNVPYNQKTVLEGGKYPNGVTNLHDNPVILSSVLGNVPEMKVRRIYKGQNVLQVESEPVRRFTVTSAGIEQVLINTLASPYKPTLRGNRSVFTNVTELPPLVLMNANSMLTKTVKKIDPDSVSRCTSSQLSVRNFARKQARTVLERIIKTEGAESEAGRHAAEVRDMIDEGKNLADEMPNLKNNNLKRELAGPFLRSTATRRFVGRKRRRRH